MRERISVRSSSPPTIEFDQVVQAWYIRFKRTKVAKTVHHDRPRIVLTVDLDASDEVVGVELLGVREFSINQFKRITNIHAPRIDFDRARFVSAGSVLH